MLRRLPNVAEIELALPPSKRDLRLDLFRGLANWLMFLGHVSTSVLAWFSFRNYGFSDGADLFVFISGCTSALVFGRRMIEGGFVFGTTRLLRPVWQIYAAHILLLVFDLASIHFLSNRFNARGLVDRFNVAHVLNAPVETITQGLLLRYKPLNLDVLPLYVVLMGAFPPVADAPAPQLGDAGVRSALFRRPAIRLEPALLSVGRLVFQPVRMAASLRAWRVAGARWGRNAAFPGALQDGPRARVGIFAPCRGHDAIRAGTGLEKLWPRALFEAFNPNDKTNLAPYRFLHLPS